MAIRKTLFQNAEEMRTAGTLWFPDLTIQAMHGFNKSESHLAPSAPRQRDAACPISTG
jgi:hypothetical protein